MSHPNPLGLHPESFTSFCSSAASDNTPYAFGEGIADRNQDPFTRHSVGGTVWLSGRLLPSHVSVHVHKHTPAPAPHLTHTTRHAHEALSIQTPHTFGKRQRTRRAHRTRTRVQTHTNTHKHTRSDRQTDGHTMKNENQTSYSRAFHMRFALYIRIKLFLFFPSETGELEYESRENYRNCQRNCQVDDPRNS